MNLQSYAVAIALPSEMEQLKIELKLVKRKFYRWWELRSENPSEFLFRSKWNENSMWFVSVEKFIFMFSKCCCPRIRVIFSHERIARKYWKLSDTIFPFLTILNIHEWTRPQELWAFKKENVLVENVKANKLRFSLCNDEDLWQF